MTKRGNHEGSVYKRERDGQWVGAVQFDGRRHVVYGKTRTEVRRKLRTKINALEDGVALAAGRAITVEKYLTHWCEVTLAARVRAGRLKRSTSDSYRDVVERHIIPQLGREPLTKLTPAKVRGWVAGRLVEPTARQPKRTEGKPAPPPLLLSARSVAYFHAVLRKALGDAVRDELVGRNVAALVEPPVVRRAPVQPLTPDEARRILDTAANDRLRTLWLVLLALGLRRGEALALQWDDLDLDNGTATIRRSLQRLRGERDAISGRRRGSLVIVTPKTDASSATIALPASLVSTLREHAEIQELERIVAPVWVDPSLVFTTTVGTALEPRNINRAWVALCDRAGVRRTRLHDLRHSAATFMLAAGVDMKAIQATLRHSRMSTTSDIYVHVLEDVQRRAAEGMDAVLGQLTKQNGYSRGEQA